MTQLSDYQNKYTGINFTRSATGVLEMVIHTRGGSAQWGTSLTSLHTELGDACIDIARDNENKVVIFTGTGDTFIAQFDQQESFHEPSQAAMWVRIYDEGVSLLNSLLAIPVPVIAAVNGPALIHAELPVVSDIVLASHTAEFADLAHFPNGVVPGDGVHTVWPMLLGPNRGRYFLLSGERIGAEEAKRVGVVAEVLAPDQLLPRARELAEGMARHSAPALRYTRSLLVRELRRRMFDELPSGLAHEALATLVR
jgi:enoyl-CoA hydratase/carnithine racemase